MFADTHMFTCICATTSESFIETQSRACCARYYIRLPSNVFKPTTISGLFFKDLILPEQPS